MTTKPPSPPKRTKKIGPQPPSAAPTSPTTAPEPVAPLPVTPKLYVVFYFEDKHGNSGFSNAVLDKIFAIRTQADILGTISVIQQTKADDPEFYRNICIISWQMLEG